MTLPLNDIEQILRQVLVSRGLRVVPLLAEQTAHGWRMTVRDVGDRILVVDIPKGGPATVRAVLEQWADGV